MTKPLRIVLIHGLATKPSRACLLSQWRRALLANLQLADQEAARLAAGEGVIRMAWWADAIPDHILQDEACNAGNEDRITRLIEERARLGDGYHVGAGADLQAFYRSRSSDLLDLLDLACSVKETNPDDYRELEMYHNDQSLADRVRGPLEDELRAAWSSGHRVALLAHSMGSIIALDVLWRFTHRSEPEFAEFRDARLAYFATMGAPLVEERARRLLLAWRHRGLRALPANIECWHNYSCLGDPISCDCSLEEFYFGPLREHGLLPPEEWRSRDYLRLHNPWCNADGKRNPHKSFGYLVQPRLASWLSDLLLGRC